MTRAGRSVCARTWEVEARRDGRIAADDAEAFERHVTACEACRAELRALEDLAAGLRASAPRLDEVAVRRARQSLAERADARVSGRRPEPRRRGAVMAAAVVVALLVVAWRLLPRAHGAGSGGAPRAPIAVASVNGPATWRRGETNSAETVVLSEGTLLFDVDRAPDQKPLVVLVPDGEIQDIGTEFRVTVAGGRTREIAVSNGRVVFHSRLGGDVGLESGMTWIAPPDPSSLATADRDSAREAASAPTSPAIVAPRVAPRLRASAEAPPDALPIASRDEAAEEDAAYLRVVQLMRAGKADEATRAAKEYLERFPNGFRRVEVERMTRP